MVEEVEFDEEAWLRHLDAILFRDGKVDQRGVWPLHAWGNGVSHEREGRCWCKPFPSRDCLLQNQDGTISHGWLHRPHGCVFWDQGEQGPQWDYGHRIPEDSVVIEGTLIDRDPVFDDLDRVDIREVKRRENQLMRPMGCTEDGE